MKKNIIAILLLLINTLCAKGDLQSLYAKNSDLNRSNYVTADYIASMFAIYKNRRIDNIKNKILIPRVLNFSHFLYQEVLDNSNNEQLIAYSGILYLLANEKQELILPNKYKNLTDKIVKEYKLITEAKEETISPIFNKSINYKKFKTPKIYKNSIIGKSYYRILKYGQIMPLSQNLKGNLLNIISKSDRLNNLYKYILDGLNLLNYKIDSKNINLFPTQENINTLFNDKNILNKFSDNFLDNKKINLHTLILKSFQDYDYKIVKKLLKQNYISASQGYFFQKICSSNKLNKQTKTNSNRAKLAMIDKNMQTVLNIMIEESYLFYQNTVGKKIDYKMINFLKKLRFIANKIDTNMKLNSDEIYFLNNIDYFFKNIIKYDYKICKNIELTNSATIEYNTPKEINLNNKYFGYRYNLKIK